MEQTTRKLSDVFQAQAREIGDRYWTHNEAFKSMPYEAWAKKYHELRAEHVRIVNMLVVERTTTTTITFAPIKRIVTMN